MELLSFAPISYSLLQITSGAVPVSFSVVRYGNVMGSRGSVIPFFLDKVNTGSLPITDPAMTRFNISLSEGVDMVLWSLKHALGGELFVPKIPSYRITDVAEAIGPSCEKPVTGIRPGEKIHEEMITASDSFSTIDLGTYYAILQATVEFISFIKKLLFLIHLSLKGFFLITLELTPIF